MRLNRSRFALSFAWLTGSLTIACGGSAPPPAPPAVTSATPQGASEPPPPAAPLAVPIDATKLKETLGADEAKYAELARVAPATAKGLLEHALYAPHSECPNLALVDVKPGPGLLVAGTPQLRENANRRLVAAGLRAKQHGMAIELLSARASVKDAVAEWNHSVIEAALALAKAASPADRKDKNMTSAARTAIGADKDPKGFDASACESGRLGGAAVSVQLVMLDKTGARGEVLVKGGPGSDLYAKDSYMTTYWKKETNKQVRTLTEIMSVGFIRVCPSSTLFTASTIEDGSWRCKDAGDSWDPPNRPLPPWE